VRQSAIVLSVLLGASASPAMAEPPNLENADHITGCLNAGRLLSFEISGWGAYRPCAQHGPDTDWITLQRANQNSRMFTVEASAGRAIGLAGGDFADYVDLVPVTTVGAFTVYSSSAFCTIAVGPSEPGIVLGLAEKDLHPSSAGDVGVNRPYMIDIGFGGQLIDFGAMRMGRPGEIFFNPAGDGTFAAEVLIPKYIYAVGGHDFCTASVTFEYLPTPSAHTVYLHDRETNEVAVQYRQED
jgi:hypothetical protein